MKLIIATHLKQIPLFISHENSENQRFCDAFRGIERGNIGLVWVKKIPLHLTRSLLPLLYAENA